MEEVNIEDIIDDVNQVAVDDINDLIEEDEEDTDALTAAQVIEKMEETWINEKFAPEILPHQKELVECILEQIRYVEDNLGSLDNKNFAKSVHQLQVDRLRFLIASYLRTRLEKIETYFLSILNQEQARLERGEDVYLTENELEFAKNYKQALEQHFDSVLSFWPGLPPNDWKNEPMEPNMYSFVFLKSKSEVEGVVIDDGTDGGDLIDFKSGSQMIMSYNSVSNLLKNDAVRLI